MGGFLLVLFLIGHDFLLGTVSILGVEVRLVLTV